MAKIKNTLDYDPEKHPEIRAKIHARMVQGFCREVVNQFIKPSLKRRLLSSISTGAYYYGTRAE